MSRYPDKRPRVTGARQLDCLRHELAFLLTDWDASRNPILRAAAGQLRRSIATANRHAYSQQREWDQASYESSRARI